MDIVTPPPPAAPAKRSRKGVVGGLVLLILGLIFLFGNYFPDFNIGRLWPVILIVIGLSILWDSRRQ